MIETLSSASLEQYAEALPYHLEITGIQFDEGALSKPRYGSLIDPERVPAGVQIEPAVQILQVPVPELRFLFGIDPLEPVVFEADNAGNVKVRSVEAPGAAPSGLVSATVVPGNPRQCELVWNQSQADEANGGLKRLVAMRLCCLPTPARELSAVEQVEGGLYLAIVNRQEVPFEDRFVKSRGEPITSTIKVLGFDAAGRPVYDLFQPGVQDAMSPSLGLEPAFRVREGQIANFSLVLDLPPELAHFQFELDAAGREVRVNAFEPEARPLQLYKTLAGDFGALSARRCALEWCQETGRQYCATSNAEEKVLCYCTQGQVASFNLGVTQDGDLSDALIYMGRQKKFAGFDPTVIQPPSCTPDGICVTP